MPLRLQYLQFIGGGGGKCSLQLAPPGHVRGMVAAALASMHDEAATTAASAGDSRLTRLGGGEWRSLGRAQDTEEGVWGGVRGGNAAALNRPSRSRGYEF